MTDTAEKGQISGSRRILINQFMDSAFPNHLEVKTQQNRQIHNLKLHLCYNSPSTEILSILKDSIDKGC